MRNQKIIFLALLSLFLMFLGANGKAKGEKCKIQQPCGMENCKAQCEGLCYASRGFYSSYCDPPNGVCKCFNWRTGVSNFIVNGELTANEDKVSASLAQTMATKGCDIEACNAKCIARRGYCNSNGICRCIDL